MKNIILILVLFIFNTIHSQVVEEDWVNFERKSKWKIHYIKNDSINVNRLYIGQLTFKNQDYSFFIGFFVFESETEINPETFGNQKFLKSIIFPENPKVKSRFEFKNNVYLLSLSEELLFRDKIYTSLLIEIENYIK